MSTHQDLSLPLLPDRYYHIFNRGNEKRNIFFSQENFRYFLQRYADYSLRYVDTLAYCLLDNHFHLFIKVKSHDEILQTAVHDFEHIDRLFVNRYVSSWLREPELDMVAGPKDLTVLKELLNLLPQPTEPTTPSHEQPTHLEQLDITTQLCSHLVSERLRRFMLSYAKSINKSQDRTGSLFQKAFRRKNIVGIADYKKVITYIHHNPIHHNYTNQFEPYPWSSYLALASDQDTKLNKKEVYNWFGGKDDFIAYSKNYQKSRWENETFYIEETV